MSGFDVEAPSSWAQRLWREGRRDIQRRSFSNGHWFDCQEEPSIGVGGYRLKERAGTGRSCFADCGDHCDGEYLHGVMVHPMDEASEVEP
jgi:hypothetical protein